MLSRSDILKKAARDAANTLPKGAETWVSDGKGGYSLNGTDKTISRGELKRKISKGPDVVIIIPDAAAAHSI